MTVTIYVDRITGSNIRLTRTRLGITYEQLAETLGDDWYFKLERVEAGEHFTEDGEYDPLTVVRLVRVAEALGVPAADLLPPCLNCKDCPPEGFTCSACGAQPSLAPSS